MPLLIALLLYSLFLLKVIKKIEEFTSALAKFALCAALFY